MSQFNFKKYSLLKCRKFSRKFITQKLLTKHFICVIIFECKSSVKALLGFTILHYIIFADVAERQTRWFQVPVLQDVWVQIPSSAPNKEDVPFGVCPFCFIRMVGFEIGRKLQSNLSAGPNSPVDCLSAKAATGGNPVIRTK